MYSRSYATESAPVSVPGGYDGIAFRDKVEECDAKMVSEECTRRENPPGLFGGLFGGKLKIPKFESDDILLLAAAAFLFFAKDGDKECAILMLILLFLG